MYSFVLSYSLIKISLLRCGGAENVAVVVRYQHAAEEGDKTTRGTHHLVVEVEGGAFECRVLAVR